MVTSRKIISEGVLSIGLVLEMFLRHFRAIKERCLRSVLEALKRSRECDLERTWVLLKKLLKGFGREGCGWAVVERRGRNEDFWAVEA